MESLYEAYEKILNKPSDWNYYFNQKEIKIDNILTNECAANKFLHTYFESGGKEVFEISKIDYLGVPHERNLHTISVFLLGIRLSGILNMKITKDELFVWFLICLYHDIGYAIENNKSCVSKAPTLDEFMKLIDLIDNKEENNIFSSYHEKRLCRDYYEYIKNEFHHIDHGITGGILLYKKLVDNYYKIKQDNECNNDSFVHKDLYYSKELFNEYQVAAKTIIEHNMWYATSDDKIELYKEYRLDRLILKEKIKLTEKNKFYFLLTIVDTIEPIKKYKGIKNDSILKNIGIDISNNKLEICILSACMCHKEYYESIKSLKEWINISVTIGASCDGKKSITLALPKM